MRANFLVLLCCVVAGVVGSSTSKECRGLSTSKLVCYYSTLDEVEGCYCTHVVVPAESDVKAVVELKKRVKGVKVYVSVNEFNQGLIDLLKSTKIDGLEVNLKKLDSKHDISDFISTIKTKIGADLEIALSVPAKADLLAKYFDFKALSKHTDFFILETAFLGASTNVTFHPSRLSGMWDMQNTDSVVDLVSGLGAPLSKLVIAAPVQAFQFALQNREYTAPGSPALEVRSIDRDELCKTMKTSNNWTLERDEDQAGPYIFSEDQWVAFDDPKSMDIKAKYSRVRGLAGIALKDLSQDGGSECGSTILEAAYNGLSRQSRAPRGAVLHSLEREIVATSPSVALDSVHLSPFTISRIIDTEGKIHVVRQDSRTEFKCSRQGYFVHPRSCNRFYRCVKFNQLTDDYNVFEFDCPAGLAFDERVEVCVWPGSLPHGTPCSGSSEIAPVPKGRFECPSHPGYYADPENCRWFFACLDHGKSSLTPYEFRCPFGLVFDGERLVCEWPWLVPKCASGLGVNLDTEYYYGADGASKGAGLHLLQNYNGLGALGVIKLGGVTGTIQRPISTVYSNVDNAALGLGYQNSGGYIEGSGLSYKAAQSLQNAGLLKVNNGVVYQAQNLGLYQNQGYEGANNGVDYQTQNQGYEGVGAGYDLRGSGGGAAGSYAVFGGGAERTVGGLAGSVNIIGGGYSAVGTLSGVDVSHNGQGGDLLSSTPAVVTVTEAPAARVTPIPTVTAVPVPGIKTATGFDTFKGGVIANIPELQYKVKTLEDAGLFNNLSTSFVNVVVTPSTHEGGGYAYHNQAKAYGQGVAVSTARPFVAVTTQTPQVYVSSTPSVHSGYVYQKPSVNFVAVSTPKPATVLVQQQPHAVVSSTPASNQYYYHQQQPQVQLYQQPQIQQTYAYRRPQPVSPYTYQNVALQAVGAHGYSYPKPEVQLYSTPRPFSVQPAVVSSYFNLESAKADAHGVVEQQNVGYSYPKPAVAVQQPVVNSYYNLETSKAAVGASNQQGFVKYSSYSTPKPAVGYVYPKPAVKFEEINVHSQPTVVNTYNYVTPTTPAPAVITYTTAKPAVQQESFGYVYPKPAVKFEHTPAVVSSYFNLYNSKAASSAAVAQQNYVEYSQPAVGEGGGGYVYQKPAVQFTYSTPAPSTVKPAIVDEGNVGYVYPKPVVKFEEVPQVTYSTTPKPAVQVSTVRPAVVDEGHVGYVYPKPAVKFEETPVITQQPAVVSSYFNLQNSKAAEEQQNYVYDHTYIAPSTTAKPLLVEQQPAVVNTYFNLQNSKEAVQQQNYASTPKPVLIEQQQPAVVSSYFNLQNSKTAVGQQKYDHTYVAPATTPKQILVEAQPAVVNTYFNLQNSKAAVQQQNYAYENSYLPPASTPKSVLVEQRPAVVSSYFNLQSSKAASSAAVEQQNYAYESNYVAPAPTQQPVLVERQPAVVNSYFNIGSSSKQAAVEQQNYVGYTYDTPTTPKSVEQQPAVVSSYFNIGSSTPKSVDETLIYDTPKPAVVHGYDYVTPTTPPPRPTVIRYETPKFNYIPSTTTAKPVVFVQEQKPAVVTGYHYPKPEVRFEERPAVQEVPFVKKTAYVTGSYRQENKQESYDYAHNYRQGGKVVVENYQVPDYDRVKLVQYQQPQVVLDYVQTTPRPTFVSTIKTIATKKLQPVTPAVVTFYDSRYTSTPRPYVTSSPEVVVSSTSRPVSRYSFSSLDDQYQYNDIVKASTFEPSREYLPVTTTVRIPTDTPKVFKVVENFVAPEVTTLSRDYLPVKVPSREYLPVRKVTTLAPEITTLSREYLPVRTRVKIAATTEAPRPQSVTVVRPVTVIKTNDAHPLLSAKLGAQCTCVSNKLTLRRKQKVILVEDTANDDYYDDSYEAQRVVSVGKPPKVIQVRPPVTQATDIFYQRKGEESTPSDGEIVKAVRTGLKLVKQAAKEGAEEGTREVLSRHQGLGTIDCQRAGLFRHPTQCNKFYSCRWDCTKKKFILHTFNCPVHLTFDNALGACNWPSQGPACVENTLITSD